MSDDLFGDFVRGHKFKQCARCRHWVEKVDGMSSSLSPSLFTSPLFPLLSPLPSLAIPVNVFYRMQSHDMQLRV